MSYPFGFPVCFEKQTRGPCCILLSLSKPSFSVSFLRVELSVDFKSLRLAVRTSHLYSDGTLDIRSNACRHPGNLQRLGRDPSLLPLDLVSFMCHFVAFTLWFFYIVVIFAVLLLCRIFFHLAVFLSHFYSSFIFFLFYSFTLLSFCFSHCSFSFRVTFPFKRRVLPYFEILSVTVISFFPFS